MPDITNSNRNLDLSTFQKSITNQIHYSFSKPTILHYGLDLICFDHRSESDPNL